MMDPLSQHPEAASRFFDKYLTLLDRHSVPEKKHRWYVKHVEAFIRAQDGRPIRSLSAQDLADYLAMIGRQNRLQDWQFTQCIDAIRIK